MVTRTSQEVQYNAGGGVQVAQSNIGGARVDRNKFTENSAITVAQAGDDRLLNSILNAAGKVATQKIEESREEAYLSGAAKAGVIQNETELDGNIFTKDWQTAGYRDTMGKFAKADAEADVAVAAKQMRDKSPEEFAEFLAQKRRELLPQLEGMSRPARKSMFAQGILSDRAVLKQHAAEHYAFILETKQKAVQTGWNAINSQLATARLETPGGNPGELYSAAVDNAFGYVNGVFSDPNLSDVVKGKLIGEMATSALQEGADNQMLYKKLTGTSVQWADGSSHPMTDLLSWDDAVALGKANVASEKRTQHFQTAAYGEQLAKYKAAFENPNVPLPEIDELRTFLDTGSRRWPDYMTESKRDEVMLAYEKAGVKKVTQQDSAGYAQVGNVQGLFSLGKTPEEGISDWMDVTGKKMPIEAATSQLIGMGINGNPAAFKKAGELVAPSITQLMMNDTIDPNLARTFTTTIETLNSAEKENRSGVFQQFVGSLSPDTQDMALGVRDALQGGATGSNAVQIARKAILDNQKLSGPARAAQASQSAKENMERVATVTADGLWSKGWNVVKGVVSTDQANMNALTVRRKWFESPETVESSMAVSKQELSTTLDRITRQRPHLSADARWTMALADVSGRTVQSDWGPLIIPQGQTMSSYFGTTKDVDAGRIAVAINEIAKPAGDMRVAFQIGNNGELMYQERNTKTGAIGKFQSIDPKSVAQVVERQARDTAEAFGKLYGKGVTTGGINYNGDNTAGVPNEWMFDLRKNLLKHEGNDIKVKNDLSGKINKRTGKPVQVVGPGITDENTHFPQLNADGTLDPNKASEAFKLASNEAAPIARNIITQMGRRDLATNGSAFTLMAELVYQSGGATVRGPMYRPLLDAIKTNNAAAAEVALKDTPAWRASGEDRRKAYLDQLKRTVR